MITKRIVLCADDYGQAQAISQGIITLIQQQRLSATSCLVNTVFWQEHATWLAPFKDQVSIGLHFNLTEGQALSSQYVSEYGRDFFTLPTLLRSAFLRKLNSAVLEAECHAQLDAFTSALGFLPQFIDGHQHIHQFPIIRDVLIKVYEQRLRACQAYVRWVQVTPTLGDVKKLIIYASGSRTLKRLLLTRQIPHNPSFAGIYAFKQAAHYRNLFPAFLKQIGDGGIIMCHPGLASTDSHDVLAAARYQEFQYLNSPQFLTDCEQAGVTI